LTYFDIREYNKPLRNDDKKDDNKLISLFKLFSPEHLLKLPFANDSNSLDKRFYGELLHIIGLSETKDGSKKIIERNKEGDRNSGSLLENAIIQLDSLDKISRLENPSQFGANIQERLFNVGLELSITWINRILFLKLLEAQLISYHRFDKLAASKVDKPARPVGESYEFLNFEKIKDYDDLNSLFFQVLARPQNERNEDVNALFSKVPYLNSSLFEPTEIEHTTLFISNLRNDKTLPIYSQTVLKDSTGKKRTGHINPLEYLFDFLSAYDFTSEGSEEIQEDNKTLINASVLGLIFEKINGYKDGSFFTPGFITMYMSRETIRKAVIQKFNEVKNWNCTDIDSLYDKIEDRKEANNIINDLKIVDPAVGSGHFLVSALNEIIAVKNDLKILQDRDNKRLKEYHVEVVNDELIVTDEDGELFEYHPTNKESQRIQETLFHEKQTIIENCLFGVDLNPNSVKICRLRLWIELLKNAYYKSSPPLKGGVPENFQTQSSPPYKGGVPEGGGGFKNYLTVPEGRMGIEQLNNLPHLKTFRKELRNNLTPAEATLWTLLKGKALDGRKFRRQHSVANYILDFYCPEEQLAIELDGQGHFEANQAEYDRERDLFLEAYGIKVLRFENKLVWDNPEGLLELVKGYFGKQPPRQTSSDTPPYKGGELENFQTQNSPPYKGGELENFQTQNSPPYKGGELENFQTQNSPPYKGGVPEGGGGSQHYKRGVPENFQTQNSPPFKGGVPEGGGGSQHYKGGELRELETLPNIDINIKCGNSLISRFALDTDLKQALKKSKWTIDSYRLAVDTYRNAQNKEQKREMEKLIAHIKSDFKSEIDNPFKKKISIERGKIDNIAAEINTQKNWGDKVNKQLFKDLEKATDNLVKLEKERDKIETNKIYENAFEWRFEFPEVLNDNGDFVGFDVVIGNPPYGAEFGELEKVFIKQSYKSYQYKFESYIYFIEKGLELLKPKGNLDYITPIMWLTLENNYSLRSIVINHNDLSRIFIHGEGVFEEAVINTCSFNVIKTNPSPEFYILKGNELNKLSKDYWIDQNSLQIEYRLTPLTKGIIDKIKSNSSNLSEYGEIIQGITPYDSYTGQSKEIIKNRGYHFDHKQDDTCGKWLEGKNLNRYSISWNAGWLKYGDWLAAPREKRFFEGKRLLFREVPGKGKRIQASIVEEEYYYGHSISPFKPFKDSEQKLEYILGIVNSKLISWYGTKILANFGKDIFPKLNPNDIKELPIPTGFNEINSISELVKQILIIRCDNSIADTTDLESQIDQLVYQLYGLTAEEIAIIENGIK